MRKILLGLILVLMTVTFVSAAEDGQAIRFADEYESQVSAQELAKDYEGWKISLAIRAGRAEYEEKEQTIKSKYNVIYPEAVLTVNNTTSGGMDIGADFGFGYSLTDTETWYVSGAEYQTNDLNLYRGDFKGRLGKVIGGEGFSITPFVGYGFRYINFDRSNFNILNTITLRDVVTEKYYIQHGDAGVKFSKKFGEKFSLYGKGTYGHVFYDKAHNSVLGSIDGKGGYIAEGDLNLGFALSDSCDLSLGGFAEFQKLKGGEKSGVIWPNNTLQIYGGQVGVLYKF